MIQLDELNLIELGEEKGKSIIDINLDKYLYFC